MTDTLPQQHLETLKRMKARKILTEEKLSALAYAIQAIEERERSAWQPIETAPKGSTILTSCPVRNLDSGRMHGHLVIAWWRRDIDRWRCGCGHLVEPTHWMPLPFPPTEANEQYR